jgi:hypothetical protein
MNDLDALKRHYCWAVKEGHANTARLFLESIIRKEIDLIKQGKLNVNEVIRL